MKYFIDRLAPGEMDLAIKWGIKEGHNPGLSDAQCFYQTDPNGFFAGKLNGQIIAIGSAVIYDDQFAFCGFYIVKPEYRGQGYGIDLTRARLNYVGQRVTGIDGVLHMVDKYPRFGYKLAHYNRHFSMTEKLNFPISNSIVDLNEVPFAELLDFDRKYFCAPRPTFLKLWTHQPNSHALGFLDNNALVGYGVIRECTTGYRIGPLLAHSFKIADALFQALITKAANPPFFITIPDANVNAKQLIEKYPLSEILKTARMYRNGEPDLEMQGCYGIASLELG